MLEVENLKKIIILKKLESIRKIGTELITLYLKASSSTSEIIKKLRKEINESENIKSKKTRKSVVQNIEYILQELKRNTDLKRGKVFFVGENKGELIRQNFTFQFPINRYFYRCDQKFHVEWILRRILKKKKIGFIILDRRETIFGILDGNNITQSEEMKSMVPGKHRAGGQSSGRFSRVIELAEFEFLKKIAENSEKLFLLNEINEVIIGGPGMTKDNFIKNFFSKNFKILDIVNTGYADQLGLKELIENSKNKIHEIEFNEEERIFEKFLKNPVSKNYGYYNLKKSLIEKINFIILPLETLSKKIKGKECFQCKEIYLDTSLKLCPACQISLKEYNQLALDFFQNLKKGYFVDENFTYFQALKKNFKGIVYGFS